MREVESWRETWLSDESRSAQRERIIPCLQKRINPYLQSYFGSTIRSIDKGSERQRQREEEEEEKVLL